MHNTVHITVNNERLETVTAYSFDSDMFMAADAFEFSAGPGAAGLAAGSRVDLWVNDRKAMAGIIDKVTSGGGSREGTAVMAEGRDMMGVLCDHCCTTLGDLVDPEGEASSIDLSRLVRSVLQGVPFVHTLNDIMYEPGASGLNISFEQITCTPGSTVFEILRSAATSRGLHFWCDEQGRFIFGKPVSSGPALFSITRKQSGGGNNVISGKRKNDITDGYSKVYVYSQSQESDGDADDNNLVATASLSVPEEFPFYRPKVVQINMDKRSPALEAKRLLNQVRAKLVQFEYTVPGHSQNGENYRTNVLAHVDDELLDVAGDYLVYARKFTSDKIAGPQTLLRLGMPGVAIYAS
ncbi:MAG: hypothetical protein JXA71_14960 [Chitinispirillaceae bacterium]|nr:hypothetical protein [Chitinispirillaceae bacterium]